MDNAYIHMEIQGGNDDINVEIQTTDNSMVCDCVANNASSAYTIKDHVAHTHGGNDVRSLGMTRSMDLIMYVLYSGDQIFVRDMVCKVATEVASEHSCSKLMDLFAITDNALLHKCLFFLMLDFHAKFRFWVLEGSNDTGLQPICHFKAVLFLKELRSSLVPQFLINETMRMDDFERKLKVEYIRS